MIFKASHSPWQDNTIKPPILMKIRIAMTKICIEEFRNTTKLPRVSKSSKKETIGEEEIARKKESRKER